MVIPRPWTRIGVAIGEARPVPRDLDGDRLESERERLQETLEALVSEARVSVGAREAASVGVRAGEGMHGKKMS
jgi:hypothetical protein